jgi:hypothetical protein
MEALRQGARRDRRRQPAPSAGSVDSPRLKTATPREDIDVDGHHKITGRQRQILVDALGLISAVVVTSADIDDRRGWVEWLSPSCAAGVKRWRTIGVDGASPAEGREAWGRGVKQTHPIDGEATPNHGGKGFPVMLWRWAVARTFAWRLNDRRHRRDEARLTAKSVAMSQMRLIRLVLHRWAGGILQQLLDRALCLGPLCGRLAFRSQFFHKQLQALGGAGTVAVRLAKMQGEAHPFLVVAPVFTRDLPGREDLAVSRISGWKRAHA